MLVCNVSLSHRRAQIASSIVEVAAAVDSITTGIVNATLVDDPAAATDIVDAFFGSIMRETATAADVVSAGSTYAAAVVEAAAAADARDATLTPAPASTAVWESATVASVTLSGGNLVATNTGTTSTNQGARVAATSGKTTGKYYFEITTSAVNSGNSTSVAIGTTASTYANISANATTGNMSLRSSGNLWANGVSTGITVGSAGTVGNYICFAVDLDNRMIWFRRFTNNWNNSGTANPATNVGGIAIPAGTMVPICTFGGTAGLAGSAYTANFGATAFTGVVPSGFTTGWPA